MHRPKCGGHAFCWLLFAGVLLFPIGGPIPPSGIHCAPLESRQIPTSLQDSALPPLPTPSNWREPPRIAYYTQAGHPTVADPNPLKVILALGMDGRMVWSQDSIGGGPPYFGASIDSARLEKLIAEYSKEGYFKDPRLERVWAGPDARTSSIVILNGTSALSLNSWHELAEKGKKVLATSSGLVPAEGSTWMDIEDEQPEEYVYFRRVWDRIREDLRNLIPEENAEELGQIEFEMR